MASANIYLKDDGSPDYERSVREAATQMGIDPNVAVSMMRTESGGNAGAVSPKGAQGLMQLMPDTAKMYGADPTDPSQNITAGLTYFKSLQDRYKGNTPLALAAYNAGPGTVDAFMAGKGQLPKETQSYVQKIAGKPIGFGETSNTNQWQNNTNGWQTPSQIVGHVKDELTNPDNMPTIGGIVGALTTAALSRGMPLGAFDRMLATTVGAGFGGSSGSAIQQQMQNGTGVGTGKPIQIDPLEAGAQGGQQSLWELAGSGPAALMRKLGIRTYSSGAGLDRPGFSQNFPTAAEEGLRGGRGTMPILTSAGARRVYARTAPQQGEMIADAMGRGVQGPTAVEVAQRGMKPILQGTANNPFPKSDRKSAIDYIKNFIEENSQVTPAQPPTVVQRPTGAVNALNQPITQSVTIPGVPKQVNPVQIPLDELQRKKTAYQESAKNALKATNADRQVQLGGQLDRGAAIGAQSALEARVPGIDKLNRRLQGQIGLNQSLNPSFRSPEELQAMGVNPEIANEMTKAQPFGLHRIIRDATAGVLGAGLLQQGHYGLAMVPWLAGSATATPFAERLSGAAVYNAGRAMPTIMRTGHALGAAALGTPSDTPEDPQVAALKLAIANGQIK